jgi:hypothetical protein
MQARVQTIIQSCLGAGGSYIAPFRAFTSHTDPPRRRAAAPPRAPAAPSRTYTFAVQTMELQPSDGVPTPSKIFFATGNNKKLQEVRHRGRRLTPAWRRTAQPGGSGL